MRRRFLSLLLIPPLLLQGAGFVHSHGDDVAVPRDHDQRQHVHIGGDGHHHHHHHHADSDDADEDGQGLRPVADHDHDDDAVYLPASVLMLARGRHALDTGDNDAVQSAATADMVSLPISPAASALPWTHPPPLPDAGCPIYLRTLTLLI